MKAATFVIVGGGMVAGYAAKQLVESGMKPGSLTIFSADSWLPYERPPLSKGFLAGRDTEDSLLINPDRFYRTNGIAVYLESPVRSVDLLGKRVHLLNGDQCRYERLLLATGSRV